MKYREWLSEWLNNYQNYYLKERTFRNYKGVIKNHILPALGEYELNELTLQVLQEFIIDREKNGNEKRGCGLASGTIEIIINVLKKSLDAAVDMGEIDYHYANKIKRPRMTTKQTECFSLAEQKMIEDAVMRDFPNKKIGILISLYMGLRIGELMALRWDDVDFHVNTVTINHSAREIYVNGKRRNVLDTPKTANSHRVIPIPSQLIPYLKTVKEHSRSEYVITTKNRETTIRSYQKLYASFLRDLNIKYRSFHTLRHTFATRALECGVDIKTISEIMGHKSPTVTLNRYSHSLIEHKIAMMNRIGEKLERDDTG